LKKFGYICLILCRFCSYTTNPFIRWLFSDAVSVMEIHGVLWGRLVSKWVKLSMFQRNFPPLSPGLEVT